ncbi:LOW QUALITY PROTEIN: N(5)-glutamine methyltransferase PrmC [Geomicrobium sp. JCM 19038]|nr:LOW QUALITY PROTEIN: N(5)-glutamine methyltransferase PrmC [Geomicrobium sp. JCM 19038]
MKDVTYVYEALNWASSFLESKEKEPRAAVWIMEDLLGVEGIEFQLKRREELREDQKTSYQAAIERFSAGEPVQYISGQASFYGRKFNVNEHVLIPRPETEELIELALKLMQEKDFRAPKIADIATGSGAISVTLSLECKEAKVVATDISKRALEVASGNAKKLGATRIAFLEGDLTGPLVGETYNVIASNPPYIPIAEVEKLHEHVKNQEPHLLAGGDDGLLFYVRLAEELPSVLAEDGIVLLEIGYDQGPAVSTLMEKAFPHAHVRIHQDLNGKDRIISIT